MRIFYINASHNKCGVAKLLILFEIDWKLWDYILSLEGHGKQSHSTRYARYAWIEGFLLFLYKKCMKTM
jgi:hypothetical protein